MPVNAVIQSVELLLQYTVLSVQLLALTGKLQLLLRVKSSLQFQAALTQAQTFDIVIDIAYRNSLDVMYFLAHRNTVCDQVAEGLPSLIGAGLLVGYGLSIAANRAQVAIEITPFKTLNNGDITRRRFDTHLFVDQPDKITIERVTIALLHQGATIKRTRALQFKAGLPQLLAADFELLDNLSHHRALRALIGNRGDQHVLGPEMAEATNCEQHD